MHLDLPLSLHPLGNPLIYGLRGFDVGLPPELKLDIPIFAVSSFDNTHCWYLLRCPSITTFHPKSRKDNDLSSTQHTKFPADKYSGLPTWLTCWIGGTQRSEPFCSVVLPVQHVNHKTIDSDPIEMTERYIHIMLTFVCLSVGITVHGEASK